jgi:hypothetical protein
MKIYYSAKTDYLEFFFNINDEYYESDKDFGFAAEFLSLKDDTLSGYGIQDAFVNLKHFKEIDTNLKIALYSWMIRKRKKLNQDELAEIVSMSKSSVQRIEDGTQEPNANYLVGLHRIDNEFELENLA